MPKLSVVIRTYNRPHLLNRALRGLLLQSTPVDEIVLVNNGGIAPERTAYETLYQTLATRNPELANRPPVFQQLDLPSPLSLGAAANEGLRRCSGDWVAFHDDDDYWLADHVRDTLAFLEHAPDDLVLLGCPVEQVLERLQEDGTPAAEVQRFLISTGLGEGPLPVERIIQHNLLPPIALWYRRDALRRVYGYAEDIPVLEDWVANRALLLQGPGWYREGTPVEYRVRETAPAGPLGNTVTHRRKAHLETAELLRNRWLREELREGRFGPESLACLQREMEKQATRLDLVQRIRAKLRRWRGKT